MADEGQAAAGKPKTPADFLKSIKGKPVIVKLNSGVDYRGKFGEGCGRAGEGDQPCRSSGGGGDTGGGGPATSTQCGVLACISVLSCRGAGVPGWLHEHCDGADRGVCEWAAEEQVWRLLHPRQQWWVQVVGGKCAEDWCSGVQQWTA